MKINWESRTTNIDVLKKANMTSIETEIRRRQLKWAGHVARMDDNRIPKKLLYGELKTGNEK